MPVSSGSLTGSWFDEVQRHDSTVDGNLGLGIIWLSGRPVFLGFGYS